jgi:hypothetical protein
MTTEQEKSLSEADLLLGMQQKIQQWQQELLWAQEVRERVKAVMQGTRRNTWGWVFHAVAFGEEKEDVL